MLVGLIIIGLLAAIIVPTMSRAKANARSTQCVGKLREIGIGLNNYFAEKGLRFPELVAARESRDQDLMTLDTALLPYVSSEQVFRCPADHEGFFENTGSSYFWNSLINGQQFGNMDLLGIIREEAGIPVVSDKENFHEHIADGVNVLYADGHVQRRLQFTVATNPQ
ncbi:MAG: hypothetical protein AAF236_04260 [Verrucomicrobiota bacterium]